jgi:hypothetical protein
MYDYRTCYASCCSCLWHGGSLKIWHSINVTSADMSNTIPQHVALIPLVLAPVRPCSNYVCSGLVSRPVQPGRCGAEVTDCECQYVHSRFEPYHSGLWVPTYPPTNALYPLCVSPAQQHTDPTIGPSDMLALPHVVMAGIALDVSD